MSDDTRVPADERRSRHPWPTHLTTDFHLNTRFVEEVGRDKAEEYMAVLREVGTRMAGRPRADVHRELASAVDGIGIRVADVELDNMADEISRSDRVEAHLWGTPADSADGVGPGRPASRD